MKEGHVLALDQELLGRHSSPHRSCGYDVSEDYFLFLGGLEYKGLRAHLLPGAVVVWVAQGKEGQSGAGSAWSRRWGLPRK